jgi:ribose 1,5-bisphosphate isomerase
MDKFGDICRKIRNAEIQGAENVAKAAVRALMIKSDKKSVNEIISLRPTEPCLRNAVNFIMEDPKRLGPAALEHFEKSAQKIAEYGAKKIENGMVVFTHCHSSSVMSILKEARRQGKKFELHNTETRPLLQGRKTASEAAALGIKVKHYVDSAARFALKKADIFLFGADAVTTYGKVINKVGTEMFAEIAEKYDIPAYCCTDSWKFDPKTVFGFTEPIERRGADEVWKNPPKNVEIVNLAFEKIDPHLIAAIISELGVYPLDSFLDEVMKTYPFLK